MNARTVSARLGPQERAQLLTLRDFLRGQELAQQRTARAAGRKAAQRRIRAALRKKYVL